ncbi:MAG: BON domain-containing protein [Armatimonadota bacterium]|nr:BON domain-containing protein [bacterium]
MATHRDREMEELVTVVLRRDSRIDLSEISVRVDDGVVYLSGIVDSAAEKKAAQENLQATAGIERIVDQLTLRNYVQKSDEELRHAVKQFLIRDIDVDAQPIDVEACGGVVTLRGRVASYAQKTEAECVAWWIPGVTDVVSHIEVDGIMEPPQEPDY